MLIVPLQPVPSQTLNTILGDQSVQLSIRQLATGLYITVAVDEVEIISMVICENLNRIVRDAYLGFIGDLIFIDNFGESGKPHEDPSFEGLGDHFSLVYLSPEDLL